MTKVKCLAHHAAMMIIIVTLSFAPMGTSFAETNGSSEEPRFLKKINSPQDWYASQVQHGKDIYISASYIFQATKIKTQLILIEYEQSILYPKLKDLCDQIKLMGVDGHALVFVEMARKILNPDLEISSAVSDEVSMRMSDFDGDPQNTPRGHYSSSEDLRRYFRSMQFLTKATFDVKVDQNWFSHRMYMLFPFEAAVEIQTKLLDNVNSQALENLRSISNFYTRLIGPSELPTFHGLIKDEVPFMIDDVLAYATTKGLPKINKSMGVGVQFLGERFCLHQMIIDNLTEKFLAQDSKITRKRVDGILGIKNVFFGKKNGKTEVQGLNSNQLNADSLYPSFYELCLKAIMELPVSESSGYSVNTGASCLTALAEQTILITKQTTLVPKSAAQFPEKEESQVKIYIEPNLSALLRHLSNAEKTISLLCEQEFTERSHDLLLRGSEEGHPFMSNSPEGIALLKDFAILPSDPTVTADVFFFSGRTDNGFLQWAIGPFETERSFGGGARVVGMEMVFFEGWNDAIEKTRKTPLTNDDWREIFSRGDYNKFKSLIKTP